LGRLYEWAGDRDRTGQLSLIDRNLIVDFGDAGLFLGNRLKFLANSRRLGLPLERYDTLLTFDGHLRFLCLWINRYFLLNVLRNCFIAGLARARNRNAH